MQTIEAPTAARSELRARRGRHTFTDLMAGGLAGVGVEAALWLGVSALLVLEQVTLPAVSALHGVACGAAWGLAFGLARRIARWRLAPALVVGSLGGAALWLATSAFVLARLTTDSAGLEAVGAAWSWLTGPAARVDLGLAVGVWALTLGPVLVVQTRRPGVWREQAAGLAGVGLGLVLLTAGEGWDRFLHWTSATLGVALGRAALFPLAHRLCERAAGAVGRRLTRGEAAPSRRGGVVGARGDGARWRGLGASLALLGAPVAVAVGTQRAAPAEPAWLTPWRLAAATGSAWGELGLARRLGVLEPGQVGLPLGLPRSLGWFGVAEPEPAWCSSMTARDQEHQRLLRSAADRGYPPAMASLAHELLVRGDLREQVDPEALRLARRAAAAGDDGGRAVLAALLCRSGRPDEARRWLARAGIPRQPWLALSRADTCARLGELHEALTIYRELWGRRHDPTLTLLRGLAFVAGPMESILADHPEWRRPDDAVLRVEVYDHDGRPLNGAAHLPGITRFEPDAVQPLFPIRAGVLEPGVSQGIYHPKDYFVPTYLVWARDAARLRAGILGGKSHAVRWSWQGEDLVRVVVQPWGDDQQGRIRGRVLGRSTAGVVVELRRGTLPSGRDGELFWQRGHVVAPLTVDGEFEVAELPHGHYVLRLVVDGVPGELQALELDGAEALIGLR